MNVCLTPSDRIIKVSNGQLVSNVVQGSVEVSYNGCKYSNLTIHVVDRPFPSLLRRDWILRIFGNRTTPRKLNRFVTRQVGWLQGFNTSAVSEQDSRSSTEDIGSGYINGHVYDSSMCVSQNSLGKGPVSEQEPCNMTEFFNKVKQNPIFEDGVGLIKDFQAKYR